MASFVSDREMQDILDDPMDNEIEFVEDYKKWVPLIDYNSPMNKICHYMEKSLAEINVRSISKTPQEIIDLMMTGKVSKDKTDFIKEKYKQYAERKRIIKTNNLDTNIEQFAKQIRKESLLMFKNKEELANAVVQLFYVDNYSQGKGFAWNVFGNYILENIIKNSLEAGVKPNVPLYDPDGDIEYLFKNYTEQEFDL